MHSPNGDNYMYQRKLIAFDFLIILHPHDYNLTFKMNQAAFTKYG